MDGEFSLEPVVIGSAHGANLTLWFSQLTRTIPTEYGQAGYRQLYLKVELLQVYSCGVPSTGKKNTSGVHKFRETTRKETTILRIATKKT